MLIDRNKKMKHTHTHTHKRKRKKEEKISFITTLLFLFLIYHIDLSFPRIIIEISRRLPRSKPHLKNLDVKVLLFYSTNTYLCIYIYITLYIYTYIYYKRGPTHDSTITERRKPRERRINVGNNGRKPKKNP